MTSSQTLDEIHQLQQALQADVTAQSQLFDRNPNDTNRRSYVRAVFGMIEGLTYVMKQLAFSARDRYGKFTPGDLALLCDKSYDLDNQGKVKEKNARLRLKDNMRFALDVYQRAFNTNESVDFGGAGWSAMSVAIGVRDRLMHPKASADLKVSDPDMQKVVEALGWYLDAVNRMIQSSVSMLQSS